MPKTFYERDVPLILLNGESCKLRKKNQAIDCLSHRATKFESLNLEMHRIWIENRIMEIMKDLLGVFYIYSC